MGLLTDHNCKMQEIPDFGSMFDVVQHSINVFMRAYERMLGRKVSVMDHGFNPLHRALINALAERRSEIIDQCFERFVRGARALEYPDSDFPYFKFVHSRYHMIGLSSVLNDAVREAIHPYTSRAWNGRYDFWMCCKWIGQENFTILIYPDKYADIPWFEIKTTVKWD